MNIFKEYDSDSSLSVQATDKNFEYWASRPYLSQDLRHKIKQSNLLLTPHEDFREAEQHVFAQSTQQFYAYLKSHSPGEIDLEICIEDSDYQEVALHAEVIGICCIVVKVVIAPIVVALIAKYINNKWMPGREDAKVKLELTVVKEDQSATQLKYEGPALELESTLRSALEAEDLVSKNGN